MGILTDFFIATRAEVDDFDLTESPHDHFPTFECKGIDPVKLATLHTLLAGGDVGDTEAVVARVPSDVRHTDEGEVMILEVPREVVDGLAGLDARRAGEVGAAWLATEEFQMDGWERAEFDEWFAEFRAFITGAVHAGKPVFLWICV